jgi:GGDEF domain-containing protein
VTDSRATFRGLLRDFRDRSSAYVAKVRDELACTARALEEILDSLSQTDGDAEERLCKALGRLRAIAASPDAGAFGAAVLGAADCIEQSVDQMRKQHRLALSQFMAEIHVLHQRIDSLESAARLDQLTRLANRGEMTERITLATPGEYCLLLLGIRGLLRAEVQFGKEVGEELTAAFAKRLTNCLPAGSEAARWSTEEFAVRVTVSNVEAVALGRRLSQSLSGQYVCLKGGKAVKPSIQVTAGSVETASGEAAEHILERIEQFFGGRS